MNPTLFFENFELLADSPNGVQKLRELILQLAVMGKLVPQDPNDEPASVLLEKTGAKKRQLAKEGKIKKVLPSKQVSEDEFPFDLPKNWRWVLLGDALLKLTDGTHHSPTNESTGDYRYITAKNIRTEGIDLKNITYVTSKIHEEIYSRCDPEYGDILYIKDGATTGITVINDLEEPFSMLSSVALMKLPSEIENKYLLYMLRSPYFYNLMRDGMSGVAITRVTLTKLNNALVSIPPLAEQKRIVSKVDELMSLCDKLEARRQKKQEIQSKLNGAALDRMLSAENQEEFEQNWRRICENFDLLYDNPENVEKLKQAILQLAVQGKLVPQNPGDEPASVLIEMIQFEKKRLVKEGKIKEAKALTPLNVTEIAYELPQGWEWCRWNDVSMQIGDIDHKMPLECEEGIPYVSPKDFYGNNGINFITAKKISREDFEKLRQKIQPVKNDIIFPRYGTIGENRFVVNDSEFLASYSCAVIKNMNGMMEPKYSYYYSLSPLIKSEIIRYINKTTQPNVGLKSIQMFVYPLPPLEEQKRIVSKVEQFMSLCDELEAKLRKEREEREKLMETVVKRLLEGEAA